MSDNLFLGDTTYPHTQEQITIECEEFYNLMQTYRHSNRDLVMPKITAEAYQAVIDYVDAANTDRIEQLEGMITQEQNRAGRIGTHSYDCHTWGHQHYECLLRKFEEAQKGHARYEYVRKLNVMQFQEIYLLGFRTDVSFDGRIDSLIDAAIQEGK